MGKRAPHPTLAEGLGLHPQWGWGSGWPQSGPRAARLVVGACSPDSHTAVRMGSTLVTAGGPRLAGVWVPAGRILGSGPVSLFS